MCDDTKRNEAKEKSTNNYTSKKKIKKFDLKSFIIQIITVILPIIWFSWIYPDYKIELFLVDKDSLIPTSSGIFINIFFICIIIIGIVLNSRKDSSLIQKLKFQYEIVLAKSLYFINERKNIKETCKIKVKTLLDAVQDLKTNKDKSSFPRIITNPQQQLNSLIEQLINNLCCFINLNSTYCIISAAYRFDIDNNNEWQWLENYTPTNGEDLKLLLSQKISTFSKVIASKGSHFICYTSKKEAFAAQEYYIESKNHINDGIIIAKHYYVPFKSNTLAEIAIFISNSAMPDNEFNKVAFQINRFKSELDELVFKPYLERMQIELLLKYIELLGNTL